MEAADPKSHPPATAVFSDEIGLNFPELIDGLSPEIPIEEKLVEEVMQELYMEITTGGCTTTAATKPSSTAVDFPATSLLMGNENGESCGAFVSDSASTVMAGIGFVGSAGKTVGSPENGGWSQGGSNGEDRSVVGKGAMDGCDRAGEVVVDDEWIERVLSTWGPIDLESS